jgi:hypothetical protein
MHVVGVLIHGMKPLVYTCCEDIASDSNLTIESLDRSFRWIEKTTDHKLPKTVFLQADNCWRENKNRLQAHTHTHIYIYIYMYTYIQHMHTQSLIQKKVGSMIDRNDRILSCN